jgi:membrane protein DedA with SNARE-associated domain
VSSLVHPLLNLHGWTAYLLVGSLCFGEVALFIGFVLPGEIAVVYGGVLASFHHVNLLAIVVLVVVCAIGGDFVGYEIGRRFGPALLSHRPLKGHPGVERTRAFLQARGAYAVFLGRFVAVVRALIPGIAGLSGVSYKSFSAANVASGVIWACGYSLAGYVAGRSYAKVISGAGTVSFCLAGGLIVALLGFALFPKVRERRLRASRHGADES